MKRDMFRKRRASEVRRQKAFTPVIERLEDRQLMSCTIDLRVQSTGGKTATVTSVGQQIVLTAYAVISGASNDDGFQSVAGSFLSSATTSGAVDGNLSASLVPAYTANGSQVGTVQDLNSDGNLDIGSNNNSEIEGFFNARDGEMNTAGFAQGSTTIFPIGLVTYTVTSLSNGMATDVNFRVRDVTASAYEAVWQEAGQGLNDTSGTLLTGTPVVISDGNAVVPSGSISGSVTSGGKGLNAVQVYIDQNNTGSLTSSDPVTETSSSGAYSFTGLAAGAYTIRESPPYGYSQTSPSGGISVTLATSSSSSTGDNFVDSVASTGSIGGTIKSSTGTALSGVTVKLTTGSTLLGSTTTSSTGTYSFGSLAAGTYTVTETVPIGYTASTPSSGAFTVSLSTGQGLTSENFVDTGTVVTSNGSISGTATSSTGSGLSGVTIKLVDTGNSAINTSTTTGSAGSYSFSGLPAGSYTVTETVPSGYTATSPSSGSYSLSLTAGQAVSGENFVDTATTTGITVNQLTGTVFGTAGSYDNSGNTIAKAVDGNLTTFFDGPSANGNVVGLDLGSAQTITEVKYASRSGWASRMNGGIFEASNSSTFASGNVVLYTIPSNANPSSTSLTTQAVSASGTYRYVEYISPAGGYGDISEFQVFGPGSTGPVVNQYFGSVFGTSGSYNNGGNTIAKAVDGSLSTYFDGPTANGDVVGLDLGSALPITEIKYASRSGFASRMNGGVFQASSSSTFSSGVVNLYTISSTANPSSTALSTAAVSGTYRYVRYVAPAGSYGDISEFEVFGTGSSATKTSLAGTVFGTAGSYQNDGNTIAKAVDGNATTFYDGAAANGNVVGLQLGSASTISSLAYTARAGFESRMVGGYFQASNSSTFASGNVTLYTITTAPAIGQSVDVSTGVTGTYLYVRYVSPAGSYGDIAEMSFYA